jgi:hypothetical protein
MQGSSNSKMCDVSISWSVTINLNFILDMFISIAIDDPGFLVITNVVKPVAIILVRPVCYVGADPGLADTISAEECAKIFRLNGHHSSLKSDPVILPIRKVNSNDIDI